MSKNNKNAAKIQKKRDNRNNRTPGSNRTHKVCKKKNTWFAKLKVEKNLRKLNEVDDSSEEEKS